MRKRLLRFFPTRRGQRLDALLGRYTGHSPFSYLLAREHGLPYRRPLALTTTGRRTGCSTYRRTLRRRCTWHAGASP